MNFAPTLPYRAIYNLRISRWVSAVRFWASNVRISGRPARLPTEPNSLKKGCRVIIATVRVQGRKNIIVLLQSRKNPEVFQ